MPKFEKEFVYFMWDDELKGKKVFCADEIDFLIRIVNFNKYTYQGIVEGYTGHCYPFMVDKECYQFVYYDPLYKLKLAHEQGKRIQYQIPNGEWIDTETPTWEHGYTYRVKPEELNKNTFSPTKKERKKTISVMLKPTLYAKAKVKAAEYGLSFGEFLGQILEQNCSE